MIYLQGGDPNNIPSRQNGSEHEWRYVAEPLRYARRLLFVKTSMEGVSATNVSRRNALNNSQALRVLLFEVESLLVGRIHSEEWFVLFHLTLEP